MISARAIVDVDQLQPTALRGEDLADRPADALGHGEARLAIRLRIGIDQGQLVWVIVDRLPDLEADWHHIQHMSFKRVRRSAVIERNRPCSAAPDSVLR